jgi:hypothetical protein
LFSTFTLERSPKEHPVTATMNGNPSRPQRKQLSEQLDRLDTILDGLSEGLNEAIIDAARAATRLAVKDAVIELLTDPDLRTKLHEASASKETNSAETTAAVPRPGILSRLFGGAKAAISSVRQALNRAAKVVIKRIGRAAMTVTSTIRLMSGLTDLRLLIAVGLTIGVAVGIGTFAAPQQIAAAVSGISSGMAAVAVQLGIAARRAFRAAMMF